jgi:hypothetical protein
LLRRPELLQQLTVLSKTISAQTEKLLEKFEFFIWSSPSLNFQFIIVYKTMKIFSTIKKKSIGQFDERFEEILIIFQSSKLIGFCE